MTGFVFYDLTFLVLSILFVIVFLSTRRKNLQRQGILYLYRTQVGVNFIDWFAKKFEKILKPLQYVVVVSGYFLMISMLWMILKTTYLYLTTSISSIIKAPPIFPVIPYFPKIFGLENLLPPLYFTYFIIALGIVAVSHEFSHGIFMRFHKIKILSTGFAFLGPILGAFVEQDEKQMEKAKKFPQMIILAAGTFANMIMAFIFLLVLALFFTSTFAPAGVKFSTYAITPLNLSDISIMGNSSIGENYVEIIADNETYFVDAESLQNSLDGGAEAMYAFDDSPAFRAQLTGAITKINGMETRDSKELGNVLQSFSPGDEVLIETAILDSGQGTVAAKKEYDVELGERDGKAYLGIIFIQNDAGGLSGLINDIFSRIKDPFISYEASWGDFGWFVYYLLWWIVVINFLVALFNMLPLGILDGGRFFYLTIWGITRRENVGKKAYQIVTWIILALFALMMVKWAIGLF
jgi:membrane-associated protease RseP (regulator of RpoE activity)